MSDTRLNCRSPYFVEANTVYPTQPVIPDPVEPVENEPPTVTIVASNESPYVGEEVTLTADASDSDGTIVSYEWGGFASGSTDTVTINSLSLIDCQVVTVRVTDNEGATADDVITICWQEKNELVTNRPFELACQYDGTLYSNRGDSNLVGIQPFSIDLGDKTGDFTIKVRTQSDYLYPVKYDLEWDGNTATTGFVGLNTFDQELLNSGISAGDINTGDPSTNASGTNLTINKASASPSVVNGTITTSIGEGQYYIEADCSQMVEGFRTKIFLDESVEINFFYDYSITNTAGLGSYPNTIQYARNEFLKNELLSYYGNDIGVYNVKVGNAIKTFDYRFLNNGANAATPSGKVVNVVFFSGSPLYFQNYLTDPTSPSAPYFTDLNILRNKLNVASSYGDHLVIFMCVEVFKYKITQTLDSLVPGISPFDGTNGLSDKPEVLFVRGLNGQESASQLSTTILNAMRELGYLI